MNKNNIMSSIFYGLFAALTLSGCGFQPMYGAHSDAPETSVTANLAQVEIATIPDRSGQVRCATT